VNLYLQLVHAARANVVIHLYMYICIICLLSLFTAGVWCSTVCVVLVLKWICCSNLWLVAWLLVSHTVSSQQRQKGTTEFISFSLFPKTFVWQREKREFIEQIRYKILNLRRRYMFYRHTSLQSRISSITKSTSAPQHKSTILIWKVHFEKDVLDMPFQ
jgi:hypothetical protein